MFKSIRKRVIAQGYDIELDAEATTWLADLGYEPIYGARPMKRVLQREIINELSKELLSGKFKQGDFILVTLDKVKQKLVFNKK
jgi:ATP-dependent Clp protease ATP-binding subunit ClpB